jgi:hypothetical protein
MNGKVGWLILALLLLPGAAIPAVAQWPSEVVPGVRVQVRLPEAEFQPIGRRGHLLSGRIVQLAPDSLYLSVTDSVGPLAIPRNLIQRLDRSRGVPSRATSALLRGVRDAVASALLVVLVNEMDDDPDLSTGEAALVGGGVGFTLGAVVGVLRPEERWRHVRLEVTARTPF